MSEQRILLSRDAQRAACRAAPSRSHGPACRAMASAMAAMGARWEPAMGARCDGAVRATRISEDGVQARRKAGVIAHATCEGVWC